MYVHSEIARANLRRSDMRRRGVNVAVVLLAILLGYLAIRHIDGPRLVAYAKAPDGTEFCVVQKCNWSGEPFTTSCYYRKPAQEWGWLYFDHQDWYWRHGRSEVDMQAKKIKVYRGNVVVTTFDWEKEKFQLVRRGRIFTGAQANAGWERPWR